jgi:hypothetical protein
MSGTEANRSGGTLEEQVAAALRTNGIAFFPQYWTDWCSVLNKKIRSDFYLPRASGWEEGLHIEVRWQDSNGSVDEKICYLKENILTVYTRPALVVIDGSQVQEQYDYLKAHADGERLIDVCRLAEFLVFANALRTGEARTRCLEAFDPSQGKLFI